MTSTLPTTTFAPSGLFVWWKLHDSAISPERLREVLAAESFTPKAPVPDIDPISGVRRAAGEFTMGRGKGVRKYKADVAQMTDTSITVSILTLVRNGPKDLHWPQVGIVEYDASTMTWTIVSDAPEHDEACGAFKRLATKRMLYLDHRWIRPNVLEHAMNEAKSLRISNGVFFAPRQHADEIRRLKRVVSAVGYCKLSIGTVGNDEDSISAVADATRDSMSEAIGGIREQLAAWQQRTSAVRSDSQVNLLGELADLLTLADTYEAALGVTLADLRSDIESARRKALSIIVDKG